MKLARRFNAGGHHTMRRVPNGTAEQRRQTAGVMRSRVAGVEPHPSLSGLGPVWVRPAVETAGYFHSVPPGRHY